MRLFSNHSRRNRSVAAVALLALCWGTGDARAGKKWRTYDRCTLEANPANDGDSFHVKYTRPGYGRKYLIRLYWVDTAESDKSIPDRVTEQAKFWDISEQDVVKLGKEATRFTRRLLSKNFTVYTKFQDARGRSKKKRIYGNVKVGDTYLAEALVEAGLARIHGFQEIQPDGPKPSTFRSRLKAAEAKAKRNKVGVWAMTSHYEKKGRGAPTRTPTAVRTPRVSTPTAAPAKPEALNGQPMVRVQQPVMLYSLLDGRYLHTLRPGREVKVLEFLDDTMARVRVRVSDEKAIEVKCRRYDLGL